jgi:arginase family enzyme
MELSSGTPMKQGTLNPTRLYTLESGQSFRFVRFRTESNLKRELIDQGPMDLEDDATAGFDLISTWDLDEHGVDWIAKKVKARVGNGPVVISLDVDVMDPSYVPASMSLSPLLPSYLFPSHRLTLADTQC